MIRPFPPVPNLLSLGLFLAFSAVYCHLAAPTISLGDSAELAAAASTLGIAHSPGYPLFVLLGKCWTVLCPFATPAYRMNIFSALCSAATLGVMTYTALRIGLSVASTLSVVIVLGVSAQWVIQATGCEVFGLNSLIASVLLGLIIEIVNSVDDQRRRKLWILASFVLGVGLGNHQTLVFLWPTLLLAYLVRPHRAILPTVTGLFITLLTAASIYSFLYIRSGQMPEMDWEEPHTWTRLVGLVTRARYGTFQLAQGHFSGIATSDVVGATEYALTLLKETLGPGLFLILAALLGWNRLRWRPVIMVLLVAYLTSSPLFFSLTHVHPSENLRLLLDRFSYLALIPATLCAVIGLDQLTRWATPAIRASLAVGFSICCLFLTEHGHSDRADFAIRDLGVSLLRNTPPNAWLFADRADEAEFSLAYLQRVEGLRPDVLFVDCNAGVSRSIYGPDYYEIWGNPRLALRASREQLLFTRSSRPAYYATHDPKMIPIDRTQTGLLFAVNGHSRPRTDVPWDQLLVYRAFRNSQGLPPSRDRGLHADYLAMLAESARVQNNFVTAQQLYNGVFAYAGPSTFEQQMRNYLTQMRLAQLRAHHGPI